MQCYGVKWEHELPLVSRNLNKVTSILHRLCLTDVEMQQQMNEIKKKDKKLMNRSTWRIFLGVMKALKKRQFRIKLVGSNKIVLMMEGRKELSFFD